MCNWYGKSDTEDNFNFIADICLYVITSHNLAGVIQPENKKKAKSGLTRNRELCARHNNDKTKKTETTATKIAQHENSRTTIDKRKLVI